MCRSGELICPSPALTMRTSLLAGVSRCREMVDRCMPACTWARREWKKGKVAPSPAAPAPVEMAVDPAASTLGEKGHGCIAAHFAVGRRERGK